MARTDDQQTDPKESSLEASRGIIDPTDVGEDTPLPADAPVPSDSIQALLATAVTDNIDSRSRATVTPRVSTAEQKPPSLLGDFRIVSKIGEGAMGVVYKAFQVSAEREVAVKILFPHMARNQKLLERFYREARSMGHLSHPNIVQGFAVGEEQGWHYLAMEYIDGRSLQKWLGLLGRLSVGDALHIVLACSEGVRYAHSLDLVHRDIKPDNILINRQGEVKLTDLGAVKWLEEDMSLTQTGHGIGTPCYMPLEQARNAKEADQRSDIYALGCVLYCLLTGKPPFNGNTIVELIMAKDVGRFTPARRFNPAVPERLDLMIDKMVAKQVKYRYQTCDEMIRDLKSLNLDNPVLTFIPPPSSPDMAPPAVAASATEVEPPAEPSLSSAPEPVAKAPRAESPVTEAPAAKPALADAETLEMREARTVEARPVKAAQPDAAPAPGPVKAAAPPAAAPTATGGDTFKGGSNTPTQRAAEYWFVKYQTSSGIVTRRMTTEQVIHLLQDPAFDRTAVASRTPTGGYKFLSTYPEFKNRLPVTAPPPPTPRSSLENQPSKYRSVYEKLEVEDQKRREERDKVEKMSDWPMYLYRLAIIALIAGFGFVLLRLVFHWLSGMAVD
jgi:serine/threonine protein kinase